MKLHIRSIGLGGLLSVCLITLSMAVAPCAVAQEVTAAINGTITDPSGAPIAGATVTATDTARGTTYTAETNSDGAYYLTHVPIGTFQVKVEAKGFRTALHSPFALVLNQVARIDVQMTVGAVSQTVEVSGATPLLQTETTDIGTHIDSVVTENVPLITGNYNKLTLLTPGAVATNPGAFLSVKTRFKWAARISTVIASRQTTTSSTGSTTIRATTMKWPIRRVSMPSKSSI